MRKVVIESPYAGDIGENTTYARRCIRDSLLRGEAPIASHLLYTQPGILDDLIPVQRKQGIDAGHAWIAAADLVVVYLDKGISGGMRQGIRQAIVLGKPLEYRFVELV